MIKLIEIVDSDRSMSGLYFKRVAGIPEFQSDPNSYISNHREFLDYCSSSVKRAIDIIDITTNSIAKVLSNLNDKIERFLTEVSE